VGLTIVEIIHAVDPIIRIQACPPRAGRPWQHPLPLHRGIAHATGAMAMAFRRMTTEKLLIQARTSHPLCNVPRRP